MNSPKNWNRTKLTISFVTICVIIFATVGLLALKRGVKNRDIRIRQEAIKHREAQGFIESQSNLFAVGPFGQIVRGESLRFYMNEEGFGPFVVDTNMSLAFDRLRFENAALKKRVEELETPRAVYVPGPRYHNPVGIGIQETFHSAWFNAVPPPPYVPPVTEQDLVHRQDSGGGGEFFWEPDPPVTRTRWESAVNKFSNDWAHAESEKHLRLINSPWFKDKTNNIVLKP